MNLRIIEHPFNPNRLLIQKREQGGEWEKVLTTTQQYISRNIILVGLDKDPLLIAFLKAETLSPRGFASLQNANTKIEQEEWDAILESYGITLEDLLYE